MLVRLEYSVGNEVRYLSHLDFLRLFTRAFRRAGLPIAYSQGFNPHPKIAFGPPLSVGVTSSSEYLDLELQERVPLPELITSLKQALPQGVDIKQGKEINGKAPALMTVIQRARYQVTVPLKETQQQFDWQEMLANFLRRSGIVVSRRTKEGQRPKEIRPGIFRLEIEPQEQVAVLTMDLQIGNQGAVRPDEVVSALMELEHAPFSEEMKIHRLGLFALKGNRLVTPLEILSNVRS